MLTFLRGRVSERKLRLFTTACARLLWERIPLGPMREAVEAAERCADGIPWDDELADFCHQLYARIADGSRGSGRNWFKEHTPDEIGVYFTVLQTTVSGMGLLGVVTSPWSMKLPYILPLTGARQPDLIRDIVGNPFRPITLDLAWLTPVVTELATSIYSDRSFDRLPTLAGLLEDAGCEHSDILGHCRGPSQHARGCWVVDLLTGRQ
jgi:hypothetical protein